MNPVRILCSLRTADHGFCQNIADEKYKAARARWALDFTGMDAIEVSLYDHASRTARHEKWRMPKGRDLCQEFTEMAIAELKYPTWFSFNAPEARNPEGARKASQKKRADWLGMNHKTFLNYWSGRYQTIYQKLENDIDIAFNIIYRNQLDK